MTVEVVVGVVGRPHGVRGEVTVEPRTDEPDRRFAPGQELRTEDSSRSLTVVSMRHHDGRLLVRFAGLEDRTAVEAVRGAHLVADVDPDERPAEPAEFYDRQLVGLRVRTPNGGLVGVVISVLHMPGQDVLEIRIGDRGPAGPVRCGPGARGRSGGRRPHRCGHCRAAERERELMRIDVVSIFPAYLDPLRLSLVGKAGESGVVPIHVHDLRQWTHDRHRSVDDAPYGGGPGMVMRPEPWGEALDQLATPGTRLVLLTPSGRTFTQAMATELAGEEHLIVACGRYEGIDARVAQDAARRMRVDEVSIGDYVLNGGEAAALVVVEAVARLLPGVIGNPESLHTESHSADHDGLLEGPVYTKPPHWRGLDVPDVLLSGHHAKIAEWRRQQALARTRQHRPDLLPAGLEGLVITMAEPRDAGELLTLQRAAFVTEARLNGSLELPPLTETLAELAASVDDAIVLLARQQGRLVAAVRGERRPVRSLVRQPAGGRAGPPGSGHRQSADGSDRGPRAAGHHGVPAHHRGRKHAQPRLFPAPRLRRDRSDDRPGGGSGGGHGAATGDVGMTSRVADPGSARCPIRASRVTSRPWFAAATASRCASVTWR